MEIWRDLPAFSNKRRAFRMRSCTILTALIVVSAILAKPVSGDVVCTNPTHVVADYAGLRYTSGQVGQTAEMTGTRIAGCFSYASTDPNSNGDDGGIVIAASSGGYWVRHIAVSDASGTIAQDIPVELDWYQLSNNDNITILLNDLLNAYSPSLYLRAPSQQMTLLLNAWAAEGLTNFRWFESDADVTIKQNMAAGSNEWIDLNALDDLVLGSFVRKANPTDYNLTFEGVATSTDYQPKSQSGGGAIINIGGDGTDCNCNYYIRANVKNSYDNGVRMTSSTVVDTVFLAGIYESSSFQHLHRSATTENLDVLWIEDVLFSDPFAQGLGWKGAPDGSIESSDDWSKARGISINGIDKIIGKVTLQYGWSPLRSFFSDAFGNDANDRFHILQKDQGFTSTGIEVEKPAILANGTKWDGLQMGTHTESGKRWLTLEEENIYGRGKVTPAVFIESNACDDAGTIDVFMGNMDWELINVTGGLQAIGAGDKNGQDGCNNRIHHFTIRGNGLHPATLETESRNVQVAADHLTIRDGTFHHIEFAKPSNYTDPSVDLSGNFVENVTITGSLGIDSGINEVALSSVQWTGSARTILTIGSGTFVTATNLSAPVGSTISGGGQLVLNGVSTSLPYTIIGDETGCGDINCAPYAESQSLTTAQDTPVTLTLSGSDIDGDVMTFEVTSPPSSGSLSGTLPSLTYAPTSAFLGDDSFMFRAFDGQNYSSAATVSISVIDETSGNSAPAAHSQSLTTHENEAVSVTLSASDVDGDFLTYQIKTQPSHGTLSGELPILTYSPMADYIGDDSFTFTASDGISESSAGTVTFTVLADASQVLTLEHGWNTVSLYVEPEDNRMDSLLADVLQNVILVKDNAGNVFDPVHGIDQIGSWDRLKAYRIYVDANSQFSVSGSLISSSTTTVSLASGWNLAPYLLDYSMPVDDVVAGIWEELVLVKNQAGSIYYPEYGIDEIGTLEPGIGYQVYVSANSDLVYSSTASLKSGAISWYEFDMDTGLTTDLHGDHDLYLAGEVSARPGKIGEAASFSGSLSDYLYIPSAVNPYKIGEGPATIVYWVYPDLVPVGAQVMLNVMSSSGEESWRHTLWDGDPGNASMLIEASDGTRTTVNGDETQNTIRTGQWNFVIYEIDPVNQRVCLEVNLSGSPVCSPHSGGARDDLEADFVIGQAGTDKLAFQGALDNLVIYNRLLTRSEKSLHFNSGSSIEYHSLAVKTAEAVVLQWR